MECTSVLLIIITILMEEASFKIFRTNQRVAGGVPAQIEDFPFIAAFIAKKQATAFYEEKEEFICAVTIISHRWCLTAAHCLRFLEKRRILKKYTYIRGGTDKWNTSNGKVHDISKYHIHELYDSLPMVASTYGSVLHDIGVVKVYQPFNGKNEAPIQIAGKNFVINYGQKVTVVGWGATVFDMNSPSNILQKVDVTLHSLKYCQAQYQSELSTMFCAGESYHSACKQDAGGPVVYRGILLGLISQDLGCLMGLKPPLYLSMPQYESWIKFIEKHKLFESMHVVLVG